MGLVGAEAELTYVIVKITGVVIIHSLNLLSGVTQQNPFPPFLRSNFDIIRWIIIFARPVILIRF
tara:strand:- start:180 stop:374 length:195 start_codon:yes stop_codon:yes gene_type:complete